MTMVSIRLCCVANTIGFLQERLIKLRQSLVILVLSLLVPMVGWI